MLEVLRCTPTGMGSPSLPLEMKWMSPGPSNAKEEGHRVWGRPQDAASWLLSFHVPEHSRTCCFVSLVLRPLEKLPTTPYLCLEGQEVVTDQVCVDFSKCRTRAKNEHASNCEGEERILDSAASSASPSCWYYSVTGDLAPG